MNRSYTINGHAVEADFDVLDNREPGNGGLDQVIVLAQIEIDGESLAGFGSLEYQNNGDGVFRLIGPYANASESNLEEQKDAYSRLAGLSAEDLDDEAEDWSDELREMLDPITEDVQVAYAEAELADYDDPLIANREAEEDEINLSE